MGGRLLTLQDEVLVHLLSWLPAADLGRFGGTCRAVRSPGPASCLLRRAATTQALHGYYAARPDYGAGPTRPDYGAAPAAPHEEPPALRAILPHQPPASPSPSPRVAAGAAP